MRLLTLILAITGAPCFAFAAWMALGAHAPSVRETAEADLRSLEWPVTLYYLHHGKPPNRMAQLKAPSPWQRPYCDPQRLIDPWGRPYRIQAGKQLTFRSDGPDGKPGSSDDVVYFSEKSYPTSSASADDAISNDTVARLPID